MAFEQAASSDIFFKRKVRGQEFFRTRGNAVLKFLLISANFQPHAIKRAGKEADFVRRTDREWLEMLLAMLGQRPCSNSQSRHGRQETPRYRRNRQGDDQEHHE